jgi:monoamine oxidase
MSKPQSVIIIGAGLSGLYAAWKLREKYDVTLLEVRTRIGGRILSPSIGQDKNSNIDLGPAWCWPQLQPRLNNLIQILNIKTFSQFTQGDMLYETSANTIQRHAGQSSHSQSYRIVGGCVSLTNKLASELDESSIHTNTQVLRIDQQDLNIIARRDDKEITYSADKIIIALPLRMLEQEIEFQPPVENEITQLWRDTPTWMAGHCKIIFIYATAFWREDGFSGEVFSQHGPMSEIYDGSPETEEYYALTAFIGLNAQQRKQIDSEELIDACKAQLARLFGQASQNIKDIQIMDWSNDPFTASEIDTKTIAHHPQYSATASRSLGNGNIILAGTETAIDHGGYLEGALESTELALSILEQTTS